MQVSWVLELPGPPGAPRGTGQMLLWEGGPGPGGMPNCAMNLPTEPQALESCIASRTQVGLKQE